MDSLYKFAPPVNVLSSALMVSFQAVSVPIHSSH